jgi:hypothetical protein
MNIDAISEATSLLGREKQAGEVDGMQVFWKKILVFFAFGSDDRYPRAFPILHRLLHEHPVVLLNSNYVKSYASC